MLNTGGLANIPGVVKNLLIINILMFVITLIMGDGLVRILGLYYIESPMFKPYQIVSHMFMHGSFFHLFFNMFALWMFGSALEQVWGPKRFLIYYIVTGLGAAVLHHLVIWIEIQSILNSMTGMEANEAMKIVTSEDPNKFRTLLPLDILKELYALVNTPVVGASGAVFGLLLGFGMLFPNTQLMLLFFPFPIKAKYFVILYGAIELFMGVTRIPGDNIAHFAHLGGMLFGFILIKIWQKDRRNFY